MITALALTIAACFPSALHVRPAPPKPKPRPWLHAVASWYVAAGGPIACGGDSYALGVASRTLGCGTRLEVCFTRCTRAIVFDYGPAAWTGRDMDLSEQVARAVGFSGVATVRYRVIDPNPPTTRR